MCNNNSIINLRDKCKDACDRLDAVWKNRGDCGIAAVWTVDGPRFFNMTETTPFQAVAAIKEEFGCKWNEVNDLIKYIDSDELH